MPDPFFPSDTSLEAIRIQHAIYRRMPPEQRLRLMCQMADSARAVAADGVRARHPDYTERKSVLLGEPADSGGREVPHNLLDQPPAVQVVGVLDLDVIPDFVASFSPGLPTVDLVYDPCIVFQYIPCGLDLGEGVDLFLGRAVQPDRLVDSHKPLAELVVLQLVQILQDHAGDDLVAVGRLEHRAEFELFFSELPGVVEEEPMEEVEQESFKSRYELAERKGGQILARVLRGQTDQAILVDASPCRQVLCRDLVSFGDKGLE
jgi:hypothetical protein